MWTANSRADANWFDSFHLIPWYGGLIAVIMSLSYFYLQHFKSRKLHVVGHICLLMLIGIWLLLEIPNPLISRKQLLNDNYVNYSYSEAVGRAVQVMRNDTDTMLVIENDPLIYWAGDVKNATHVLEYYSWILTVPQYRNEIVNIFKKNPPEFVVNTGYFDNVYVSSKDGNESHALSTMLSRTMHDNYVMLDHDNKSLVLYISKEKRASLSDEQKRQLNDMLFHVPEQ